MAPPSITTKYVVVAVSPGDPVHTKSLNKEMVSVVGIVNRLYKVFLDYDAELAEINPLVITPNGLLGVDAKLLVDDNSLYRHKDLAKEFARSEEFTEIEKKAKDAGLSYVELEGDIGVIGCGAGLVMASLDTLKLYGGMQRISLMWVVGLQLIP